MDNTTNNVTTVPSKKKEKMKQIRKEQYQKFELSGINLNTSEIKIDDFLEARKKELSNFIDILSHKVSTKGGHQLLPKHMRRRAMSHNPFRIGVKNIIGKFNSETTSKCRKHKLKKKHFLKSINRRRIKTNWLETHIWHAKRFRMTTLFNRKLAFSRADKSLKACLKYSKYSVLFTTSLILSLY